MVRSVAFLMSGRHGSFPSGFLQTRGACENSNRGPPLVTILRVNLPSGFV